MCTICLGQENSKPYNNPDNTLDLQAVYQNYDIVKTGRYGNTSSEKAEFLLLRVNEKYLADNDTGINRNAFKGFLSDCPPSLDLALNGLDNYSSSESTMFLRTIGSAVLYGGGLIYAYKGFSGDQKKSDRGIAAGLLLGGITYSYVLKYKAKSQRQSGHDKIIDALNLYSENCYNEPDPGSTPAAKPELENGETNDDEKIEIEMISNNAHASLSNIGVNGSTIFLDNLSYGIGANLGWYKKGWYVDGVFTKIMYRLGQETIDNPNTQFSTKVNVGIPIFSGVKEKSDILDVGSAYGIQYSSKLNKTNMYRALSLEGGVQRYQMYFQETTGNTRDYFVKSTMLRGGLAFSLFTQRNYIIKDERFSSKVRKHVMQFRLYANAVYNYNNEYDILPSNGFLDVDPTFTEIGYVGGFQAKLNSVLIGLLDVELEIGKYPIHNDLNGFGGTLKMGIGLYRVK